MPKFNSRVYMAAGAIKTIQQLVQEAIAARSYYSTTGQEGAEAVAVISPEREADEVARWNCATVYKGFFRPVDGTILLMDGYKGVWNGVVTNAHDGITLAEADFDTAAPGQATAWIPGQAKDLEGVYLGGQVAYAAANTYIDLDNLEMY